MDERRFDDLTRMLGRGLSRRAALRGAVAGVALAFGGRGAAGAKQARCGNASCGKNPGKCKPGCVCCVYGNGNNRCMPPESCSGTVLVVCPSGQRVCPGTGRCGVCCGDAECGGLSDACGAGVCDAATGQCRRVPAAVGTTCGGDLCTITACDGAGVCLPGTPTDCGAAGDACNDGVCDPATGGCVARPKLDGTGCDDGDACTVADACVSGRCTGQPTNCDDGIACTEDRCDPGVGCVSSIQAGSCLIDGACVADGGRHPANPCQVYDPSRSQTAWAYAALGTACDDTTLCNGREACNGAGSCVAGVAVNCPQPLGCQEAGVCDDESGECTYLLKGSGSVCRAAAGACQDDARCDGTTPDCPANPIQAGEACDDGNACTTDATCQADGSCTGAAIVCADDGLACTDAVCDPVAGCTHTVRQGACLIDGVCYRALELNPASGCQRCNVPGSGGQTAWTNLPEGSFCGVFDFCDGAGDCDAAGHCVLPPPVVCDPPTSCQPIPGVCNPSTGRCDYPLADDGVACDDGGTCCGGVCTNLVNDVDNCGACGVACDTDQQEICARSTCLCGDLSCSELGHGVCCDWDCVDIETRDDHCGACGHACPAGESCCEGGVCNDKQSDPRHCGACDHACDAGEFCFGGICECGTEGPCPAGHKCCNGTCIDVQSDPSNCNACGHVCDFGWENCCDGVCRRVSDMNHCNGCGNVCPPWAEHCVDRFRERNWQCLCGIESCVEGQDCCHPGGDTNRRRVCTDMTTTSNCGACGSACAPGQSCVNQVCTCPTGQALCGGACIDTQSDLRNCGACGAICRMGQSCVNGACVCPAGLTWCGFDCVDLQTNAGNCGRCGSRCQFGPPGGIEFEGVCCGGVCLGDGSSMQSDPNNCGGCGIRCNGPTHSGVCSAGTCQTAACPAGFANCDGNPATGTNGCETNLLTDVNNCGACGNLCGCQGNGGTCLNGICCNTKSCANNCGQGCCNGRRCNAFDVIQTC